MVISEIQAQYVDENDLFRTVRKRIYEEWDAPQHRWILKKIEYIFENPAYPVPSDDIEVSIETRHGWVIPPDWKFSSEVWVSKRKLVDEVVTDGHERELILIEED